MITETNIINAENKNVKQLHLPTTDYLNAIENSDTPPLTTTSTLPLTNSTLNSTTSPPAPTPTTAFRTQPFSFSTDYTQSRLHSNNSYNSTTSFQYPPYKYHFPYKPLSSFTVLNNNDELSALSYLKNKPNAIVHPTRRADTPTKPPDNDSSSEQAPQCHTRSLAQEENTNTTVTEATLHGPYSLMEELEKKLRYLSYNNHIHQEAWLNTRNSSQSSSSQQDALSQRPLFITTVPKGVFLPPPKEPPLPAFLRHHAYAYATYPMVLSDAPNHNHHNRSTFNNNHISNSNFSHKPSHIPKYTKHKSSSLPPPNTRMNAISVQRIDSPIKMQQTARTSRFNGNSYSYQQQHGIGEQSEVNENQQIDGSALGGDGGKAAINGGVHITKTQFQQQLQQNRVKREVAKPEPYKNMMYEKRVIKGPNFGLVPVLTDTIDPFDKAAELRRRKALQQRKVECRKQRNIIGTPPPVSGRHHEEVQTEKYLEKIYDRPSEYNVETQTDIFLERPPPPRYAPSKIGIDVGTEIGEGELFHFDAEAEPIIDILVDSAIEQSILEVAHEQEIAAIRKKQEEFLAQREAELAVLRRLEQEEIRLQAEKQRRLRQEAIAKELDEEMQKGVTAAKLLQGHIASLIPEVLDNIEPASDGDKKDELIKQISPWLSVEVAEEVGQIVDSREILTMIIEEIIKQRACAYADYCEEEEQEQNIGPDEDEQEECELICEDTDDSFKCSTLAEEQEK